MTVTSGKGCRQPNPCRCCVYYLTLLFSVGHLGATMCAQGLLAGFYNIVWRTLYACVCDEVSNVPEMSRSQTMYVLHTLIPTLQRLPQAPFHTLPHQHQEQRSAEITYHAVNKINPSKTHKHIQLKRVKHLLYGCWTSTGDKLLRPTQQHQAN